MNLVVGNKYKDKEYPYLICTYTGRNGTHYEFLCTNDDSYQVVHFLTEAEVETDITPYNGYSNSAPEEPGWYWMKSDYYGEIPIKVFRNNDYLYIQDPQDTKRNFIPVKKLKAEWARIEEPKHANL